MSNENNSINADGEQEVQRVLSLRYQARQRVNFASAQNDVAIIERLEVDNRTEEALTDVRITLRAAPPIIREKVWTIDRIGSEEKFAVRDISTPLDIEHLAGLDEAELGELEFRVEAKGRPTIIDKCRIDLLARDEWGGVRDMAQILAAFVSPNEPAVAGLVKDAARLLESTGHDGSMNGYQSGDPRRAYLLAASIWSAVTGLGLTYAEPPASFERNGQKIRGPGRITNEGLAACLDSTLLLAAAFEAAGLNPVVLFSHGHAWVGVWLCKKDFGHVTEPDVVAVRKAVQAREFASIETTLLTSRPSVGIDQAVDQVRRRLSEDRDPEFVVAVDIKLERRSAQSPFRIAHHEDDVRLNLTLLEFLERDFDLRIPELEGEMPRDESGINLPLIFETMRRKVRDTAGFEVVEEQVSTKAGSNNHRANGAIVGAAIRIPAANRPADRGEHGLLNRESRAQCMALACWIELALEVISVVSTQARPSRNAIGIPRGIESVWKRDSDKVADQVTIVEIVPDEDFGFEPGCAQTS